MTRISACAVAGAILPKNLPAAGPEPSAAPSLPTISLGKYRIGRLVVGSNPIHGYSYQGPHADRHMREYFTVDRTVEFLQRCQGEGINLFQFSSRDYLLESIARLRERSSAMHLICLHSDRKGIKDMVDQTGPIAMVHHGGATDKLFGQGKSREVHDYVKASHDRGVMAGVSAHNPDCIRRIADEGWEVDFFMTCFYFLTRASVPEVADKTPPLPTLETVYPFYKDDPLVMTRVIRQVKQPCLAFKILAGGRLCSSQETVQAAFRFAFEHIKPSDGVIVGMYPRFFDEIRANAEFVRRFGTHKLT